MASLFNTFSHRVRPTTVSLFGIFTSPFTLTRPSSSASAARCSRFLMREASEFAPRECPTPLVLLRARGLEGVEDEKEDYYAWGGMFSERGYTAVEIDIEAPKESASTRDSLQAMAKELSQQIRLMMIPFPPIIVSSGSSTLLSQTFISDHPASALVLINPPSTEEEVRLLSVTTGDNSAAVSGTDQPFPSPQTGTPSQHKGFDYEPHFPILFMSTPRLPGSSSHVEATPDHRLIQHVEKGTGRGGKGVSLEVLDESRAPGGERGEGTRMVLERWLDRCGY